MSACKWCADGMQEICGHVHESCRAAVEQKRYDDACDDCYDDLMRGAMSVPLVCQICGGPGANSKAGGNHAPGVPVHFACWMKHIADTTPP